MRKGIVAYIMLVTLVACHEVKAPEKPKNLIAKDEMVNIIIDINLLSASKAIDKSLLEKNNISVQTFIYDKYGIDSLTLANSHEYYAFNIDTYDDIYLKVNDSLKGLRDEVKAEQEAEERRRMENDSVKEKPVPKTNNTVLKSKN